MKTTIYSSVFSAILLLCTTWTHAQVLEAETLSSIIEYWESIDDDTPEVTDV